jgi:nucleoside-diphosphate-sugar epimerase
MRVLWIGGTGPVGHSAVPILISAGHEVALAHSGRHEAFDQLEHLHGSRTDLLAANGPAERWRPEVVIDTFAGGASAAKATELAHFARRVGLAQVVALSSMDVYRQAGEAGVDGHVVAELPSGTLPISEQAALREPGSVANSEAHDNVAMEAELGGAERLTILRPGAIYGPHNQRAVLREWFLVGRVARRERRLGLPMDGTQIFHRVAIDRVGRAIAAATARAPAGTWACNVGDPELLTYGALARLVAERLDWEWELVPAAYPDPEFDHPWNVRHPVYARTRRLEAELEVLEPEPVAATVRQIEWLWDHRDELERAFPGGP